MADENKNPNPGVQNPEQEQEKQGKQTDGKLSALMASYRKSYPGEKTFHVTSDYQVFLGKDLALAKMHQRKADAGKEVQTVKA